ncbi:aluminum-activated malate transporter 9-like [Mangifera indica]|uniref:aluminum-activated malate transporter 9-like n=1 Tax=Mangifera indica TaxID=29780 RepID=UPI001CFAFD60|nr:aluminum-activated malate transporter 9-like [Mangifera indica]
MNGKKGSVEINIPLAIETKQPETTKTSCGGDFFVKAWIQKVWEFYKEDSDRVKFSFKVGLAVLLVSLLILFRAPYEIFGTSIIWSILTVAIMFEYTVGSTFNRGFNRALGSLLAGILAIAVGQLALSAGVVAEPIIIGISIFFIGVITSFVKQWSALVAYEYGFRVILFTYCLIIVSGYRMGNPIRTSMDRLYSISIGGFVAVLVNVLVFPIWAGEQLHKELVNNFNIVADSLEECAKKYLEDEGLDQDHPEFSKTVMDEFPDEPAYKKCKATLNSSSKLDYLAISAKWEPPHGRFRHFFYPWAEYVKVGAVLRYCAYEVMALHGVLHSEIQAPCNLRITFQAEIQDVTSLAAEVVRSLGKDIGNMNRSLITSLLKRVHSSTERLQRTIDMHSYLLTTYCDPPDVNPSKPLPKLPEQADPESNSLENNTNSGTQNYTLSGTITTAQAQPESYNHEMTRKQSRRMHSWPSREVDAFEEEGVTTDFLPRMRALESTAALSLATFTSLLIEFVARLDHLVEAVDKLAKTAKFKHEGV